MKILIENLGPIKSFDFDLSKDLNIIYGQNNIGKSYAITAVYLIIKNFLTSDSSFPYYDYYFFARRGLHYIDNSSDQSKKIRDFITYSKKKENEFLQKLNKSSENEIIANEELKDLFIRLLSFSILPGLERSFDNSFSSLRELKNQFSNGEFKITLNYKEFNLSIGISSESKLYISDLLFSKQVYVRKVKGNRKIHRKNGKIYIYHNISNSNNDTELLINHIMSIFSSLKNEITNLVNNIYFLPASRSGLYQALSTFSAVIAELSKSRNFLTQKIELPNISEPVSDYFLYLSNVSKPAKNERYNKIGKFVEESILRGEVKFNFESHKIVFYSPEINSELDLSVTSSMISEIAPIVAFLKFIISDEHKSDYLLFESSSRSSKKSPANVIFIEEPEAHLHPKIQVLLMDVFIQLIECNVKIIMTSHSNYMFNKLSNVILKGEISPKRVGSYLMKMTTEGSVIDETSMKADSEGIVDENFANISEELFNERMKIYEDLNN